MDSFFARLELAAQDDVAEMGQEAAAAGARLGRAESELPDGSRPAAGGAGALKQFLGGMLSQGVADAGTMRAEPSRMIALRRGEAERLVPRDSILTFVDLMARVEGPHAGVSDETGRRALRQLTRPSTARRVIFDPVAHPACGARSSAPRWTR